MDKRTTYAVFYKRIPADYDPHPGWTQYCEWVESLEFAKSYYDLAQKNARFAEVKIVERVETFIDIPGLKWFRKEERNEMHHSHTRTD